MDYAARQKHEEVKREPEGYYNRSGCPRDSYGTARSAAHYTFDVVVFRCAVRVL